MGGIRSRRYTKVNGPNIQTELEYEIQLKYHFLGRVLW